MESMENHPVYRWFMIIDRPKKNMIFDIYYWLLLYMVYSNSPKKIEQTNPSKMIV